MKRCFYISNSHDGSYFVLTDDLTEYIQRISAYVLNLESSKKCNHYSFGSIELTQKDYLEMRSKAIGHESRQIQKKQDDEEEIVPVKKETRERPHLRLV